MAYDKNARPNRKGRKKVCAFCVEKVEKIDYKDTAKLRRYTSERAKILPRRVTGTCAYHQILPFRKLFTKSREDIFFPSNSSIIV